MKDLPKVFANKIDKKMNNNNEYNVSKNEAPKIIENNKSINQKINEIFSSYRYVYKADVIITTEEGEIIKKIIGKNKNNLITIDNELISIDKIKDIRFVD